MTEQNIDAVELLIHQHRELESLLDRIAEESNDQQKRALFAKAADHLTVHIKSEEDIFYPAVNATRTEDDLLESLEEHLSLKRFLADLLEIDPSDKAFEPKFKVLKEQTEHHHKEEEEHLFPVVRQLLTMERRAELGKDMLALQLDLKQQGHPRTNVVNETSTAAQLPS